MKILIACECSGRVREAFRRNGHDAISCDLLASEDDSPCHFQGDWREVYASSSFDAVIAFPPCTHLCVSGARHFAAKRADGRQQEAINFFLEFTRLKCPWAIENPVGIMSTIYRKPDQIIQPWQFGHGETKATCIWLNRLRPLEVTCIVAGRENRIHRMAPSPERSRERSRTFTGIADAMGVQWGKSLTEHCNPNTP